MPPTEKPDGRTRLHSLPPWLSLMSSGVMDSGPAKPSPMADQSVAVQSVSRMTLGLDNDRLFVGTDDGKLLSVNLATGVEQVHEMGNVQVMALAAVPGSGHIVSGFRNGQVVVWDNRMLLHSRRPMDDSKNRFMWRTQTRGEPVVPVEV